MGENISNLGLFLRIHEMSQIVTRNRKHLSLNSFQKALLRQLQDSNESSAQNNTLNKEVLNNKHARVNCDVSMPYLHT